MHVCSLPKLILSKLNLTIAIKENLFNVFLDIVIIYVVRYCESKNGANNKRSKLPFFSFFLYSLYGAMRCNLSISSGSLDWILPDRDILHLVCTLCLWLQLMSNWRATCISLVYFILLSGPFYESWARMPVIRTKEMVID